MRIVGGILSGRKLKSVSRLVGAWPILSEGKGGALGMPRKDGAEIRT